MGVFLCARYPCKYWADGACNVYLQVCGELKGRAMRKWGEGEERRSELVLIGRNLDPMSIEASFRSCLLSGCETLGQLGQDEPASG